MKLKINPYSIGYNNDVVNAKITKLQENVLLGDTIKARSIKNPHKYELLQEKVEVPHLCVGEVYEVSFDYKDRAFSFCYGLIKSEFPKLTPIVDSWGRFSFEPAPAIEVIETSFELGFISTNNHFDYEIELNVLKGDYTTIPYKRGLFLVHKTTGEQIPITQSFAFDKYEVVKDMIHISSAYEVFTKEEIEALNRPTLQEGWIEYEFERSHTTNRQGWYNLVVDGEVWDWASAEDTDTIKVISGGRVGNGGGRYACWKWQLFIKESCHIEVLLDCELEERRNTVQEEVSASNSLADFFSIKKQQKK